MSSRPSRGAARLAAILDALPDALLLVNANGTVVNANSIALGVFESPGTGLVGRGLLSLLPEFDSKLIPGSMRRPGDEPEGRTKPKRMTARRTDGTEFPAEVTSAALEDGREAYADAHRYTGDELLMLVVRDLSGTVDTEAELARSQRQTEMILRAAAEGVVGTDTDGRVVLVNPAAAQILGYRATELGNRELHALVGHSRADGSPFPFDESPLSDTLRSGRKHRVRGQVLWNKAGKPVSVDLTTSPVRDGEQLVGAVMTFTDRRPYDALAARHAQLLALADEGLRGPLEELRGELATLAADDAGQLWPEANQLLHHLAAGYSRMTVLLDNVLGFQRLDAGKDRLSKAKVLLDEVVAAAVEGAVELIGPGRAQFAVHAPAIEAEVDAARLATALSHLVADVAGVDATGKAPLSAAGGYMDSTIVVAVAQRGRVVRIEVRGPYAGGNPVHEPIVRGIVAAHGGVLQTVKVPGTTGSAYVLEVPLGAGAGTVTRPERAPEPKAESAPVRGGAAGTAGAPPAPAVPAAAAAGKRARRGVDAFLDEEAPGSGQPTPQVPRTPQGAASPPQGLPAAQRPRGPQSAQGPQSAPASPQGAQVSPQGAAGEGGALALPSGRRRAPGADLAQAPVNPAGLAAPVPADGTGRRRGRALEESGSAAAAAQPVTAPGRPPVPPMPQLPPMPSMPPAQGPQPVPPRGLPAAAPGGGEEGHGRRRALGPAPESPAPQGAPDAAAGGGRRRALGAPAVPGARAETASVDPYGSETPAPAPAGPGSQHALQPVGAPSAPNASGAQGAPGALGGPHAPTGQAAGGPAAPHGQTPAGQAVSAGAPGAAADAQGRRARRVLGSPIALGGAPADDATGHDHHGQAAASDDHTPPQPHPLPPAAPAGDGPPTGRRRALPATPAAWPVPAARTAPGESAAGTGPVPLPGARQAPDSPAGPIPVRALGTLGQGAALAPPSAPAQPATPPGGPVPAGPGPAAGTTAPPQPGGADSGIGRRRRLTEPDSGADGASLGIGRAYAIGAPAADAAEGPEPLDGPGGAVEVLHRPVPPPVDDELPPEPLDNPRRLLVWPAPDVTTQQALSDRGYRPVIVHSREEVDAQIAAYPAALFVDPLTGPITRTALQSLRQAAVAAEVPVLVTAGLGQATREAAYGADPAVLLKALAPRDSEQHPSRVLLLEQHDEIAQALTAAMERRGMQVARAGADTDAVELASRIRPNLVVMDLMQVRRRRAGIVDWLRANGQLNRTPLVVYTSVDIDKSELTGLGSGETVLFLAERATTTDVQGRIVDLLAKIGTN